jgi:hypothetical protein
VQNVRVEAQLQGPQGNVIVPELRLVGYVPVTNPTPAGFGVAGRYPDPLLPMKAFDLPENEGRSVWLTAWVPRDAPPGEYKGNVVVSADNTTAVDVPISLYVHDVTLPVRSYLKTFELLLDGPCWLVYGQAWSGQRTRDFVKECLRYRFTAPPPLPWSKVFVKQSDGKWTANWEEFDRQVQEWLSMGITVFRGEEVPAGWGPPPAEQEADARAKVKLLGEHLAEKGWSDLFAFYPFDEPPASAVEGIKALCDWIHRDAPNLRILLTAAHQDLAGHVNIWVPHIHAFDGQFLAGRKKAGDEVWVYVCIMTAALDYPDVWRIDWTGAAPRAVGWWCWRYGCEGFLYWSIDFWRTLKGKYQDVYQNPVIVPPGNGDGFLFYPDPDKGEPVPSIRVDAQRDGFEDYDLLCMLKQAISSLPSTDDSEKHQLLQEAAQLLDAGDIIQAPDRFSQDSSVYEKHHRAILEMLEKLEHLQKPPS